jgi:hypothetical protein
MQGFKGFQSFPPLGGTAKKDEAHSEKGASVFNQMLQQMQQAQQAKKTANKSQVDMLWPLGTAMDGKKS